MLVEHTREALTRRALPTNLAPATGAKESTILKRCPARRAFSFTETNAGKALFGEKPFLENVYSCYENGSADKTCKDFRQTVKNKNSDRADQQKSAIP